MMVAVPAVAQVPAPPPVGGGVKVIKEGAKDEPGAPDLAPVKGKGEAEKGKGEAEKTKSEAEKDKGEAEKDKGEAEKAKGEAEKTKGEADKAKGEAEKGKGSASATATATDEATAADEGTATDGSDAPAAASTPASTSTLEEEGNTEIPPSPNRKLEISPRVRARISGQPPEDEGTRDPEMAVLKEFEERAFPRPGPKVVHPGDVSGAEGVSTGARRARPGALNPPEGLGSKGRTSGGAAAKKQVEPSPPGWISGLAMPDLPVKWTPRLLKYLEFYRKNRRGRAILRRWFARMGRYRELMEKELHRQKMPRSFLFLAMIESGYDPRRTSRVGAGGLWQFMPFSGKGYGLRRDYWIDERRNPKLSTEAALKFLKDLYIRFGSWELAMASYNAGYGAIQKAVQKYNTNDYWTLCTYEAGLPWSTCNYVPKIMAVAVVDANRKFFGYENIKEDAALTHELVAVTDSITLAQAARAAGVETDVLDLLNPELRRDRTPPGVKSWLRVPRGKGEQFYAGLAKIKPRIARYKPYLTRLGETVRSIAKDHRISRERLRRVNGFQSDNELTPGLTILVPARVEKKKKKKKKRKKRSKGAKGKGKRADAEEQCDEECQAERMILVGIPRQAPSMVAGRRRVFYRVTHGDDIPIIARHLEVNPDTLASWNALDTGAKLVSGMVLQAFVDQGFDGERVVLLDPERVQVMVTGSEQFLDLFEQRKGRKRQIYTARKGDTLRSVGRAVGLTIGDLARINQFSRHTKLEPGQQIIVYHDPAKARKPKRRKRGKKRRGKRRTKRRKTS